MQLRGRKNDDKIETQMAPMIDVVFQLLIFFMLTLKIIEPEGDFNINLPIAQNQQQQQQDPDQILPDIRIRLESSENGLLNSLRLGGRNLGNDENAFRRLNAEILKIIGRPGNPLTKDMQVEIDADYGLNYEYVIRAVSACTGRFDPNSKQIVRYVEKIKFAPPRREGAAGA